MTSGACGSFEAMEIQRLTTWLRMFSVRGSNSTLTDVSPPGGTVLSLTSDAVHPQEEKVPLISSVFLPMFLMASVLATLAFEPILPKL